VGVAADPSVGLEERHVVIAIQVVGGDQSRYAGTDDRDLHDVSISRRTPERATHQFQSRSASPSGVRVQGSELYFSDVVNNVIDKVSTAGTGLARVAGSATGATGFQNGAALTTASFNDPTGLSVDGSGRIFVADTHNYAIREISGGAVSTIAGTGTQQLTPANPTSGTSAASFELANPFGVVEDNSGNVLIADYGASCILKVVPAGTISTWGGTCDGTQTSGANNVAVSATTLGGPSNLTFDSSGNLYVNEYAGQVVREVSSAELIPPTTPTVTNVPTTAVVGGSFKAAVNTNGDGVSSVTSNSTPVCTVGTDGLTVHYVTAGTCSLTAQVTAGTLYLAASGSAQTFTVSSVTPPTPPTPPTPAPTQGYWMVATDGGIFNYGTAGFFGSAGGIHLNQPIVGMASTADGKGYWLVARDGGIFNYGDAGFYGSAGSIHLNKPIVGMAATPDGKGYWLVASDGGIFNYGDAGFFGSAGAVPLNKPIVGMAASPTAKGYWLVASDGGIFNYGDAKFFGSTGAIHLNQPIVGMAASPSGKGYWMVATDGGIFNYGDAGFFGSTGSIHLNSPIWGVAATPDGKGYWLVATDGGIFNYGDATFHGSAGSVHLNQPVIGIAPGP